MALDILDAAKEERVTPPQNPIHIKGLQNLDCATSVHHMKQTGAIATIRPVDWHAL
ncbi:hypothetical protein KDH83_17315 [Achromobacter sp. Marseille-Q0513]|uniref:hypothetical protein n=1 Tax=Achromobacter sp. Marseille-Q0513 TaxID=2829161 RepID=UPI001B93A133|nr:hypothetical protein [Achromobacter sp. Marseille-Q0513]MBR8655065.1 hypothetical protein [Achromobacter sp. Marseille-Q0513]